MNSQDERHSPFVRVAVLPYHWTVRDIPSDEYDAEDSDEAIRFAETIVGWVNAALAEIESNP